MALYVKSNIQSVLMTDIKANHDIESVWVDILMRNKSYRIGAFYRPPDQSQDLDVEMVKEIESACHSKENGIIIMGDFNFPNIQWDSLSNMDGRSLVFINCLLDNFLSQVVHEPTRHTALLDLILTNDDDIVDEVSVEENLGISDHNIIRFNMNVVSGPKLRANKEKILDFKNGDFTKFKNMLNGIDWDKEFENQNCFIMWERFKQILINIQSVCFKDKPIREVKRKPIWWNREIREKINLKRRYFKIFKGSSREEDLENYRRIRNELNQSIRKAKRMSEINLARNSNKDPKKFFSFYNFKSKNRSIGPIKIDEKLVSSDEELVDLFNAYFTSVFTEERLDNSLETNSSGMHVINT